MYTPISLIVTLQYNPVAVGEGSWGEGGVHEWAIAEIEEE